MQSKSKTILPVVSSKVRTIGSVVLAILSLLMSAGHTPFLILLLFFSYQLAVKPFFLNYQGEGISFQEAVLVGPAKVVTAGLMVAAGIPDNNAGFFWIGCSFLMLSSGIKNLYFVMRMSTVAVAPEIRAVSARQAKSAEKQDEALLADLAAFLDDFDSPNN